MLPGEMWRSLVSKGAAPLEDDRVWPWEPGLPVQTMGVPHAAACVFGVPLPQSHSSAWPRKALTLRQRSYKLF